MFHFIKKHKKAIIILLVIGIVSVGGAAFYIYKTKFEEKADYLKHCYAAHRLHELFVGFNEDYMGMPGPEAAEMDDTLAGFNFDSSNGYLAQLLVAMNVDSEEFFFLKGSAVCEGDAPDNIVAPNEEALRAGENGWAYFKGRSLDDPKNPALLVPGWDPSSKKYDQPVWSHGIPVLHVDGSVILYNSPDDEEYEPYTAHIQLLDNKEFKTSATTKPLPFKQADPQLIQPLAK